MKTMLSIPELDRVVKFVHALNELGKTYKVGLCLGDADAIHLQMDGKVLPLQLDSYDEWDLSLVVSL